MIGREHRALGRALSGVLFASACIAPIAAFVACRSSSPGDAANASSEGGDSAEPFDDAIAPSGDASCTPHVGDASRLPDGDVCGLVMEYPCGPPGNLSSRSDCYFSVDDCNRLCPVQLVFNCRAMDESCVSEADGGTSVSSGPLVVDCERCPGGVGRRPEGLASSKVECDDALGEWLARAAHLEAASVHAFARLREELASFDAPPELTRAALRAEHDEARHARITARLAKRHGAKAPRAQVEPFAKRSLEELAIENAVEGCVREAYGAFVAAFQAEHARDRSIAVAMKRIAEDELDHAALARAIDRWACAKLDPTARARVERAKEAAFRAVAAEISALAAPLECDAGFPPPLAQHRLLEALHSIA